MHDAPSVTYPVGRCRFAGTAIAVTWLFAGCVIAGWLANGVPFNVRHGVTLSVWLIAGIHAAATWWRSPCGRLRYTGGSWRFDEFESGPPRVALDLQRIMLLESSLRSRPLWLWVEQDTAPSDWDALRRAVYSRANTAAPQGASPPLASP